MYRFQSTLPMRGATTIIFTLLTSITIFQSTLPMRGATVKRVNVFVFHFVFQSTLPMRGATWSGYFPGCVFAHFNPHSPCGERLLEANPVSKTFLISIHTPHAGSDNIWINVDSLKKRFQSTLPMRGATVCFQFQRLLLSFQSTLPMRGATAKVTEFTLNLKTKL